MPRRIKYWVLLLSLFCVATPFSRGHSVQLATADNQVPAPAIQHSPSLVPERASERTAPQKAYDLLTALQRRNGAPLPGYIGGNTFRNRERRLPQGRYREYDVNRKTPGRSRDAERLVIEQQSGKAYYTDDHYRTFIPLN
jgi:ribonuclease T1